jgi:uncharacterized tellurite resistance protein B-like protein
MLKSLRDFLDKHLGDTQNAAGRHTIEVATAALLAEVMRMDGEAGPAEREAVLRAVRGKFGLSPEDAQAVIDLAEAEARDASDYYQFTSIINQRFDQEQKVRVIGLLWEVAYADASLSVYEEHLIRKLADLLHVSHGDYITAKLRARDGAKARTPPAPGASN